MMMPMLLLTIMMIQDSVNCTLNCDAPFSVVVFFHLLHFFSLVHFPYSLHLFRLLLHLCSLYIFCWLHCFWSLYLFCPVFLSFLLHISVHSIFVFFAIASFPCSACLLSAPLAQLTLELLMLIRTGNAG